MLGSTRHEVLWSDLISGTGDKLGPGAQLLRAQIWADLYPQANASSPWDECLKSFVVYMLNDSVRAAIIQRFTSVVDPLLAAGDQVDVIAHSWGTVVAYEGLIASFECEHGVVNWFTPGCPLHLTTVSNNLLPQNRGGFKPAVVETWVNMDAAGDPIGGSLLGAYAVDHDMIGLPPIGCTTIEPLCCHQSYFNPMNVAVNEYVFAAFINTAVFPSP